jgi:hypothetical protein
MVKMTSIKEKISFVVLVGHHKNLEVETIYKLAMIGDVLLFKAL